MPIMEKLISFGTIDSTGLLRMPTSWRTTISRKPVGLCYVSWGMGALGSQATVERKTWNIFLPGGLRHIIGRRSAELVDLDRADKAKADIIAGTIKVHDYMKTTPARIDRRQS